MVDTLSLVFFFDGLGVNENLAIEAGAAVYFMKCGTNCIAAPSCIALFLHAILNDDKS